MKTLQILRMVLVSPGDVEVERKVMKEVIDDLNHGIAADRNLQLELSLWETDVYPGFHAEGPQGLIDPILRIEDCDILLGIFWKRFGTPTRDAQSGTEHEIRTAIENWEQRKRPQIMMYFKEAAFFPQTEEEATQLGLVMRFRKEFPKEGLYWKFKDVTEFGKLARSHLTKFIREQYQLMIPGVLDRPDPEAVHKVKVKLPKHPPTKISSWERERAVQAGQDVFISEPGGYELVKIPGGVFLMGSPEQEAGRDDSEGPLHKVQVPDFYLGRYPVTNEEYARFLKENPKVKEPAYWADRKFNQPRQPIVGVSWEDARCYAEWAGLRLPSEAEWEYACRAGTKTRYYSGDSDEDLDRVGWYNNNSGEQLHTVGEKEPNAFGLYDMHGNAWEWVEDDWHGNYKGAPKDGRAWVDKRRGSDRVIRGGGWGGGARGCRSADRGYRAPVNRYFCVGFRLARSVNP